MLRWIAHRIAQCVNWNKKLNKINLSNLFGLLGNEKKKNQIKFDKIFAKIKFSKNEIFENKILLKTIF